MTFNKRFVLMFVNYVNEYILDTSAPVLFASVGANGNSLFPHHGFKGTCPVDEALPQQMARAGAA